MLPFNFFHKNWISCDEVFQGLPKQYSNIIINLDNDFIDSFSLDVSKFKEYRISTANLVSEIVGEKIGLCFSGGIDSQCMVQCFKESNLNFDVFILRFNNNLNHHDIDSAINYCKRSGIHPHFIDLDIINFLQKENYNYGIKYKSLSPHFNVHYKMFNIIADMGYNGVVAGGDFAFYDSKKNTWGSNLTRNSLNYINYSTVSKVKCIGNFLSFNPYLSWALSLTSKPLEIDIKDGNNYAERLYWEKIRYNQKIDTYRKLGFNIIPQAKKYTGFELVKAYLKDRNKDGWAFEKLYRYPLIKTIKNFNNLPMFVFKHLSVEKKIKFIYSNLHQ